MPPAAAPPVPPSVPAPPPAAPTPPPAAPTPPPAAPTPPPTYSTPPVAQPPSTPPPYNPGTPQAPATPQQFSAPGYGSAPGQGIGSPSGPPVFEQPSPSQGSSSGGGRGPLIAVVVVLLAALGGVAALVLSGGDDDDDTDTDTDVATATTVPVATLPDQTTTTPAIGEADTTLPPNMTASVADLAESTVQILLLSGDFPVCSGSGTIIDDSGTILTNAHVIEPGGGCDYDRIGVAITSDAGRPPELLYIADVYAYDPVIDLAVVRIATDLDGAAAPGPFRSVPVGDSDAVEIGDQLRILGYPGIGGDTVTFTNGVVSGFASQNGIGERSWIKTDATIAGGNSGGAAFDDDGILVGVPTQAAASSTGEIVDCRVITDTNGDGQLNGEDQCVPIGGFLNGLRPVNLAIPLIEQAASGAPISIQSEANAPPAAVDFSTLNVFNPGWSLIAPDDPAFDEVFVSTATAGVEQLCLWFDWTGIPDGAIWDGVWQVDGELEEGFSFFSEEWNSGATGINYWLCALDSTGLQTGLYEFIFYIEGEVIFYESFEITDTPRALHELTFLNNTDTVICYLYVAPFGAINTGLDELGTDEVFEVGVSKTVVVPEGTVIADAYDCDFNPIYEQYDGLAITGPLTVEITN